MANTKKLPTITKNTPIDEITHIFAALMATLNQRHIDTLEGLSKIDQRHTHNYATLVDFTDKLSKEFKISVRNIEKGKDGYTPKKGIDYKDGHTPIKGKDYFDGEKGEKGEAGSPDTGEEIVEKLVALDENDSLPIDAIKNLRTELNKLNHYFKDTSWLPTYYGGVNQLRILSNGILTGDNGVKNLNFIGAAVTNDDQGNATININNAIDPVARALAAANNPSNIQTEVNNIITATASPWKNKVIAWYGTSIPQGCTYPQVVAGNVGATIYKRAQGGSYAKIIGGTENVSYYENGQFHTNLSRWSETVAEKAFIIANYATIVPTLTDTNGAVGVGFPNATQMANNTPVYIVGPYGNIGSQDCVTQWSFEYNLIGDFMNVSSGHYISPVDLIVLDHGFNDLIGETDYDNAVLLNTRDLPANDPDYTNAVAASRDRLSYLTAMNSVIDQIYRYNPYQRICIISHYERNCASGNGGHWLVDVQEELAKYWGIPICKVYEKVEWGDQTAIGSQPLWAELPWSTYAAGQNTSSDMTIKNVWIPDRTHPFTDPSGKADAVIAKIITNFINTIF